MTPTKRKAKEERSKKKIVEAHVTLPDDGGSRAGEDKEAALFMFYLELGQYRSFVAVAAYAGVSTTLITRLAAKHKWAEKATVFEKKLASYREKMKAESEERVKGEQARLMIASAEKEALIAQARIDATLVRHRQTGEDLIDFSQEGMRRLRENLKKTAGFISASEVAKVAEIGVKLERQALGFVEDKAPSVNVYQQQANGQFVSAEKAVVLAPPNMKEIAPIVAQELAKLGLLGKGSTPTAPVNGNGQTHDAEFEVLK